MIKLRNLLVEEYKKFVAKDSEGKLRFVVYLLIKYELFFLKWSILGPIIIGTWFTSTISGFSIMFILGISMYICPYPVPFCIFMLFSDIIASMVICITAAQFEFSCYYLRKLIGEENFKRYVGENPASNLSPKLLKITAFIVALGITKLGIDLGQSEVNGISASKYAERCRREGVAIDPATFHGHFHKKPEDFMKDIFSRTPKK